MQSKYQYIIVTILTVTAIIFQDQSNVLYLSCIIFFNLHKTCEEDTIIFIFIGEKWQCPQVKHLLKLHSQQAGESDLNPQNLILETTLLLTPHWFPHYHYIKHHF